MPVYQSHIAPPSLGQMASLFRPPDVLGAARAGIEAGLAINQSRRLDRQEDRLEAQDKRQAKLDEKTLEQLDVDVQTAQVELGNLKNKAAHDAIINSQAAAILTAENNRLKGLQENSKLREGNREREAVILLERQYGASIRSAMNRGDTDALVETYERMYAENPDIAHYFSASELSRTNVLGQLNKEQADRYKLLESKERARSREIANNFDQRTYEHTHDASLARGRAETQKHQTAELRYISERDFIDRELEAKTGTLEAGRDTADASARQATAIAGREEAVTEVYQAEAAERIKTAATREDLAVQAAQIANEIQKAKAEVGKAEARHADLQKKAEAERAAADALVAKRESEAYTSGQARRSLEARIKTQEANAELAEKNVKIAQVNIDTGKARLSAFEQQEKERKLEAKGDQRLTAKKRDAAIARADLATKEAEFSSNMLKAQEGRIDAEREGIAINRELTKLRGRLDAQALTLMGEDRTAMLDLVDMVDRIQRNTMMDDRRLRDRKLNNEKLGGVSLQALSASWTEDSIEDWKSQEKKTLGKMRDVVFPKWTYRFYETKDVIPFIPGKQSLDVLPGRIAKDYLQDIEDKATRAASLDVSPGKIPAPVSQSITYLLEQSLERHNSSGVLAGSPKAEMVEDLLADFQGKRRRTRGRKKREGMEAREYEDLLDKKKQELIRMTMAYADRDIARKFVGRDYSPDLHDAQVKSISADITDDLWMTKPEDYETRAAEQRARDASDLLKSIERAANRIRARQRVLGGIGTGSGFVPYGSATTNQAEAQ